MRAAAEAAAVGQPTVRTVSFVRGIAVGNRNRVDESVIPGPPPSSVDDVELVCMTPSRAGSQASPLSNSFEARQNNNSGPGSPNSLEGSVPRRHSSVELQRTLSADRDPTSAELMRRNSTPPILPSPPPRPTLDPELATELQTQHSLRSQGSVELARQSSWQRQRAAVDASFTPPPALQGLSPSQLQQHEDSKFGRAYASPNKGAQEASPLRSNSLASNSSKPSTPTQMASPSPHNGVAQLERTPSVDTPTTMRRGSSKTSEMSRQMVTDALRSTWEGDEEVQSVAVPAKSVPSIAPAVRRPSWMDEEIKPAPTIPTATPEERPSSQNPRPSWLTGGAAIPAPQPERPSSQTQRSSWARNGQDAPRQPPGAAPSSTASQRPAWMNDASWSGN